MTLHTEPTEPSTHSPYFSPPVVIPVAILLALLVLTLTHGPFILG